MAGAVIIVLLILGSILIPVFSHYTFDKQDYQAILTSP